jgi:Ca2+-binding RTX toxin-like protein
MTAGGWKALSRSVAACLIALPALTLGAPAAQAKNGDTHITGIGIDQTIDCNESALIVNGTGNTITALGTCWAVTMQGSSNTVVADNVINDITVYGSDQTVFYKNGDPVVWDRGRELGMMNRIDRVPA